MPGISDLVDEDIVQILSQLSFTDLLAMRRTCRRFRHLAQHTFHSYPRNVEVVLLKNNEYDPFDDLQRLLEAFGPHIENLSFNGLEDGDGSRRFFNLLLAYCNPSALKCLKLVNANLESVNPIHYVRILKKLETIGLFECIDGDNTMETLILQCSKLKSLSLVGLNGFNVNILSGLTPQLESLNMQYLTSYDNSVPLCVLNIGSRIKRLILRHVCARIVLKSNDIRNIHTLQLDLVRNIDWSPSGHEHCTPVKLLPFTSNKLRHLHLSNVDVDVDDEPKQLTKVGNQLESFSVDNTNGMGRISMYIQKVLDHNANLRSVKLCYVGDESLFHEVPRSVPNIEELCIWPAKNARHFRMAPINMNEVLKLTKLKSFSFFCETRQTADLLEQLTQMDSLESLGFPIDANDFNNNFDEKLKNIFSKFKNLKCLKLALSGGLEENGFQNIAMHFVDLEELKIVHGNVETQDDNPLGIDKVYDETDCHDFTNCGRCGERGINERELSQFEKYRPKHKTPLKIYQTHQHHDQSLSDENISGKLRQSSYKGIVRLLPLSTDGFFEFFPKNSPY